MNKILIFRVYPEKNRPFWAQNLNFDFSERFDNPFFPVHGNLNREGVCFYCITIAHLRKLVILKYEFNIALSVLMLIWQLDMS